jgi:23S rRNA (guanosine2251-2'-O)-methyltransferase
MMEKMSHQELMERQLNKNEVRIPVTVVLNNIRSLYNVGSILRTSDGVGVEKVWICGITGLPTMQKVIKTALGAEKVVPWAYVQSCRECVAQLKRDGYQIVILEQVKQSIPYERFAPKAPVALVLGNEITGVSEELVGLCDQAIEIEMAGLKNSLNVTVAFGIVAYYLKLRFSSSQTDSNLLMKQPT